MLAQISYSVWILAAFAAAPVWAQKAPQSSNLLQRSQAKDELTREWRQVINGSDSEALLTVLKKIQKPSPFLPWALIEAARQLYAQERWSEFFGIATYVRTVYPKSPLTDKIRVLEILALIRHCQWEQGREKVVEAMPLIGTGVKEKFKVLADLLHVAPEVAAKDTPKDRAPKPKYLFSGATMWPVGTPDVATLNPFRLRRKVPSKCDEQKEFDLKQNEEHEHDQE